MLPPSDSRNALPSMGIDAVSIARMQHALDSGNERFVARAFTLREVEYARAHKDPTAHFAGIFAAKEAASKALGTSAFPFLKLEVAHEPSGKPVMLCDGEVARVSVSITHTHDMALAVAVA